MVDKHYFLGQRMNLDDDSRVLKENETRQVYNLRSGNTSTNGKGCLENIKSNLDILKLDINAGYSEDTIPVYYNIELSQVFNRDNCSTGYSGTGVLYTVPARTYHSIISQEDADNQAQADITTNGQNYANSHGSCILTPSSSSILWNFYAGQPFANTIVKKGGISMSDDSGSGSFPVSEGDVIYARVVITGSGGVGYKAALLVHGTGLSYEDTSGNTEAEYTFTWTSSYGDVTIVEDVRPI